jgi:hypothetical protein
MEMGDCVHSTCDERARKSVLVNSDAATLSAGGASAGVAGVQKIVRRSLDSDMVPFCFLYVADVFNMGCDMVGERLWLKGRSLVSTPDFDSKTRCA